ncbi:alkylmercury lyase family protein [Kribbella sancticallisti]
MVAVPPVDELRAVLGQSGPAEVLSAWRRRALPLDACEQEVHRAILRRFASTGRPPAPADLDELTAYSGRSTADVLRVLHELDAIRLMSDGGIAVAYPFSATPTRHRVRIADRVELYAMCAIDALGISPMVGEDSTIESVDVTSGRSIRVVTRDARRTWEPGGAVVFVGADAGGGPSADCCCDYLNFFADRAAAEAWVGNHPDVPGQVLDQAGAEELAARLFGHLLAGDNNFPA